LSEATETIQQSLKFGVNYIDTSPWYGESEKVLGEALKGVPRNAYFIGTKVGRNYTPGWDKRFDFSRSAVLRNVENSLALLGLSYVDIIEVWNEF
jgi:L-galactose dehydrogenase